MQVKTIQMHTIWAAPKPLHATPLTLTTPRPLSKLKPLVKAIFTSQGRAEG